MERCLSGKEMELPHEGCDPDGSAVGVIQRLRSIPPKTGAYDESAHMAPNAHRLWLPI